MQFSRWESYLQIASGIRQSNAANRKILLLLKIQVLQQA